MKPVEFLKMTFGEFKLLPKIEKPIIIKHKNFNIYLNNDFGTNYITINLVDDYFNLFQFKSYGYYMSMFKTSYYTNPIINIMMQEYETFEKIIDNIEKKLLIMAKNLNNLKVDVLWDNKKVNYNI